jgi:hypothetical protein
MVKVEVSAHEHVSTEFTMWKAQLAWLLEISWASSSHLSMHQNYLEELLA